MSGGNGLNRRLADASQVGGGGAVWSYVELGRKGKERKGRERKRGGLEAGLGWAGLGWAKLL